MKASSAATAFFLATEMVLTLESRWEIPTASHVYLKLPTRPGLDHDAGRGSFVD
jgi:hypothetical protein